MWRQIAGGGGCLLSVYDSISLLMSYAQFRSLQGIPRPTRCGVALAQHPLGHMQNDRSGPYAGFEIVLVTVTSSVVSPAFFGDAAASVGLLQVEAVTFHGLR